MLFRGVLSLFKVGLVLGKGVGLLISSGAIEAILMGHFSNC